MGPEVQNSFKEVSRGDQYGKLTGRHQQGTFKSTGQGGRAMVGLVVGDDTQGTGTGK